MISKEQAIQLFEEVVLPAVRKREMNSAPNKNMRQRVWRNFINTLKEDGNIILKQNKQWSYPVCCEKDCK
jgi:hypothetical protein